MLTLLIGIIVVVGACYLGFVFYQRRTIKMATDVYENKRDLNKIPLDDEFALAKKLNLTGESQKNMINCITNTNITRIKCCPALMRGLLRLKMMAKGLILSRPEMTGKTPTRQLKTLIPN